MADTFQLTLLPQLCMKLVSIISSAVKAMAMMVTRFIFRDMLLPVFMPALILKEESPKNN